MMLHLNRAHIRWFMGVSLLTAVIIMATAATGRAKDVTLAWDPSLDENVDHYVVYWGTESGNYTQNSPPINDATSYTVEGLEDEVDYYFAAKAVDPAGLESDFSNEAAIPKIDSPEDAFIINAEEAPRYPLQGRAAAAASVEIFLNASPLATTTASEDGRWSVNADFTSAPETALELKAVSTGAESVPVGGQYDKTAPLSQIVDIPSYGAAEIAIQWTASDAVSGVATTALWYKKGADGEWIQTGLSSNDAEGFFLFNPPAGDGVYYVATRSVDKAGNAEPVPTAQGKGEVISDQQAPASNITSIPTYGKGEITIHWTASDAVSGVATTELWYKKGADGDWSKTQLSSSDAEGIFLFTPPAGDGVYYVATRSVDKAGNAEPVPTAQGKGEVISDQQAPVSTITSIPSYGKDQITIQWAASDAVSGIASIELWSKKESNGEWMKSAQASESDQGAFQFSPNLGEGIYYFATRAIDRAGNAGPLPAGTGEGQMIFDNQPPNSNQTVMLEKKSASVRVEWTASDDLSGVASTSLFYKYEDDNWSNTGLSQTGHSGTFTYSLHGTDGTYAFQTRAVDRAGNEEPFDSDGSVGEIVFDNTPPTSTITEAPALLQGVLRAQFTIRWTASDDLSSIDSTELWVKKGAEGVWENSGLPSQEGETGFFTYQPALADGVYYFATRTSDSAENIEEPPAGNGETSTLLQVDLSDAIMALQVLAGIEIGDMNKGGDVNGDMRIGIQEAIYFLKTVSTSG